jgi:beta-mannosidase
MKREVHEYPKDKYTRVYIDRETRVYLWASNFTLDTVDATLQTKAFDIVSGEKIDERNLGSVTLSPNQSSELVNFKLPAGKNKDDPNRVVVAAYLVDKSGKEIARFISWPDVLK